MKSRCILFAGVIIMRAFVLCVPFAFSEDNGIVNLDSLIDEAEKNNPRIQAAQKAYLASEELFKQAVSLEDPKLTAGYFAQNVETRVGPQVGKYGISQKFPFFGKLTLKGRIALKERDIAYQKFLAVEREVVKELKHAYYDLYWIRKSTAITEDIKGLLDELEKVAESKYSTGIASQQDVMRAQVEISKLIAKLYTLSEQEVTLREKINMLLSRPVESPIGRIGDFKLTEFPYALEDLLNLSEKYRQELKAASLDIGKHSDALSLEKKNYFPDFTLGVDFIDIGAGHTSAFNDGQDAWMGMVAVNLPVWQGRIKAGVDEAREKLASSEDVYRDVKNTVAFQVKDELFQLRTCEELLNVYENALIPQAEESLKASQAGYETGKADFLDLIDSERILLNFKIAYYKAISEYEKSIADLERAVGLDVKKIRKIIFPEKGAP